MNESYDFTPNIALRLPKGTHKFQLSDLTDNLKIIDKQIGDRLKFVDSNGQVVQDIDGVVNNAVTTVVKKSEQTILDQLKEDLSGPTSSLTQKINNQIQDYLKNEGLTDVKTLTAEQKTAIRELADEQYKAHKDKVDKELEDLQNNISNFKNVGLAGTSYYLTQAQFEAQKGKDEDGNDVPISFAEGDIIYIYKEYSGTKPNDLTEEEWEYLKKYPPTESVKQITKISSNGIETQDLDIPMKAIVNNLNARAISAQEGDFVKLHAHAIDAVNLSAISGDIGDVLLNNGSIVLDTNKNYTTSDIALQGDPTKIYLGNNGLALGDQMVFDMKDRSLTFSNDVILKFAESDKLKDIINNTQNKNSQELYNTLKAGGYIKTETTVYTYYDKDGKLQENKASYPDGYTKADALEKGKNYYIEGKAYTITQPTEITKGYIKTDELYVSKIQAPLQGMLYSNGTSISSSTTLTDSYINSIKVSSAFNFQDSLGNTKIAIGPGGFTTTGIALNLASSSQETATELGQVYLGAKISGTKDEDSTDFSSYIIKDGEIIEGTADRPQRDYYSNILLYPERDKIYQNDYLVVTGYKTVDGTKKTSNRLYVSQVRIKDVIGTITKTVQKGTATAVFG